jgi:ankyrin repeat protein
MLNDRRRMSPPPVNFKVTPRDVLNKKYADGRTPLHVTASRGSAPLPGKVYKRSVSMEALARTLIDFGANVDAMDNRGYTPLHLAAARGDLYMVDILLRRGADPNCQTLHGDTPLYVATFWEQAPVIRKLIRWGADADIANADGKTARSMAIEEEKPSEVIAATRARRCCPKDSFFSRVFENARCLGWSLAV